MLGFWSSNYNLQRIYLMLHISNLTAKFLASCVKNNFYFILLTTQILFLKRLLKIHFLCRSIFDIFLTNYISDLTFISSDWLQIITAMEVVQILDLWALI
jgi:hypothetical protein